MAWPGDDALADRDETLFSAGSEPVDRIRVSVLLVLVAAPLCRENGLADVANHSYFDFGNQQRVKDVPVVGAQVLHLIDQDLVANALQPADERAFACSDQLESKAAEL